MGDDGRIRGNPPKAQAALAAPLFKNSLRFMILLPVGQLQGI
jgi:hypothetical protein